MRDADKSSPFNLHLLCIKGYVNGMLLKKKWKMHIHFCINKKLVLRIYSRRMTLLVYPFIHSFIHITADCTSLCIFRLDAVKMLNTLNNHI